MHRLLSIIRIGPAAVNAGAAKAIAWQSGEKPTTAARALRRHSIDFSLGGSLGYLVRDANRAFQRLLEKRISPHGVTRGQWYFLRVLWEEDGLSQRELSARASA